MDTIGSRIKALRNTLEMTQKEFGNKIAVAQTYLSQMEKGDRDVTEKILLLICNLFPVNENWLRTGQGTMLLETKDSFIDTLMQKYSLDELDKRMIQCYLDLTQNQRAVIKDYICKVAETDKVATTNAEVEKPLSNQYHELTDKEKAEIDAECESYRHKLEAEAFPERSPAGKDNSQKDA